MKVNVASAVKNIVNWAFPLFFLGGLLYLVYDDYRDNGTATEEQLLMISHKIPCAGEDFRTALRNSPGPLTLRDAKKIAAKCNEKYKQLNALNDMSK
ncbi:TPA: hypothetical protein ME365_004273 [Klebsiella pneumoniae]|uniref:hypothetical protein n=1 Tax=Klebsiella pneumoniae TaxID=573 RepID=UPI000B4AB5BF|nr:hypothetical protein [Klebsiella pneumoniae]ASC31667.1 hypothetical protein AM399_27610 [Klebsiella pneumoniae]SXA71943.1 Uncharacterised protein [Klebsiella pneumoniae]SXT27344.1 Uncharacterised protein [Klebsiella pneumoniae]HBW4159718.1 hypothetical protein [Klebsiella pneumoniae]HBW4204617.1 hypothetical protein [Klebsiella pneumoniae]